MSPAGVSAGVDRLQSAEFPLVPGLLLVRRLAVLVHGPLDVSRSGQTWCTGGAHTGMDIELQSSVPAAYYDALERLVFFNTNQPRVQDRIVRALDLYGSPEIVAGPDGLRVSVIGCPDAQCLFALTNGELAGMLVYIRNGVAELLVLHIAVADCCTRSRRSTLGVVCGLLRAVRSTARRLRGVKRLRVLYRDDRQFGIPISGAAERPQDDLLAPRRLHGRSIAAD